MDVVFLVLYIFFVLAFTLPTPWNKERVNRIRKRFQEAEDAGVEGLMSDYETAIAKLRYPVRAFWISLPFSAAAIIFDDTVVIAVSLVISIPLILYFISGIYGTRKSLGARRQEIREVMASRDIKENELTSPPHN